MGLSWYIQLLIIVAYIMLYQLHSIIFPWISCVYCIMLVLQLSYVPLSYVCIPRNIRKVFPSYSHITTDWWFGTFFIFPYVGNNLIIPTDFHIFQRDGKAPTRPWIWIPWIRQWICRVYCKSNLAWTRGADGAVPPDPRALAPETGMKTRVTTTFWSMFLGYCKASFHFEGQLE
jgi:hypothetical protein